MKKIIAISVMFVLLTGAVFAADLSGLVNANVNVLQSDNQPGSEVTSSAEMKNIRLEGSGGNDDGTFGGWIRVEGLQMAGADGDLSGHSWESDPVYIFKGFGYAWWKPIDQLLVRIGQQPDGFWTKEGVAGWGFYQTANDSAIVAAGNTWGGSFGGDGTYGVYRNAFYGGLGGRALMLEITPLDMLAINIALPVFQFDGTSSDYAMKTADVFQFATVQVDLKFDFGNIAISYVGGIVRKPKFEDDGVTIAEEGISDPGKLFAYFGGSFGAISLDVGLGYHFAGGYVDEDTGLWATAGANPIWIGAGVKYSADSFGVKGRLLAGVGGDDKATHLRGEVMPFFIINDNMRAFVPFGIGFLSATGGSMMDWQFTPYVEIGQEWGPKFVAGISVHTENDGGVMYWSVPIGLLVGF